MTQGDAEDILRRTWRDYVGSDRTFYYGALEFDWGSMQVVIAARAMVAAYEAGRKAAQP
jgi:hypothetical protein